MGSVQVCSILTIFERRQVVVGGSHVLLHIFILYPVLRCTHISPVMPPGQPVPKYECPHCGKWHTQHTINIHLAKEVEAFELLSLDLDGPNNNNNPDIELANAAEDLGENNGDLNNNNPGDVDMESGPEHQGMSHLFARNNLLILSLPEHDKIDLGLAGDIDARQPPNPAHIGADVPILGEH